MMSQTTQNNPKTDLAPFEIWEVMLDNSTIKFHEPLVLTPTRMPHDPDEPGDVEYWEVEVPELAISSWGEDHDELVSAVHGDICFAWRYFVEADDTQLAADAKAVKKAYLEMAEVIDG